MHGFLKDLRFGFRQIKAKPGFAAAAILTLALGIGANTAVFSVLSGYLLKPLPYPHAGHLAQVNVEIPKVKVGDFAISMPIYQVIQQHTTAFAATAVYGRDDFNLNAGGRAQRVGGVISTASLFHVLGVHPMLGQTFTKANMKDGNDHVVVISYALWRSTFGADPGIVGKTVKIESNVYRIIGVMPQGFAFPDRDISIWVPRTIGPKTFEPQRMLALNARFIGWLKPAVKPDVAQRQVRQAVNAWTERTLPIKAGNFTFDQKLLKSSGFALQARSYRQKLLGDRPATLWLLQGAVLLILLITCVNVANLLLSRILGRSHEMAVRSTLGATRSLLARQLLGEALCLAVPGGLIGIALAWLGLHFLGSSALGGGESIFNIALDWRVGLFAIGAVLLTAALVSVLPIRHLAKTDLQKALQDGSRTAGGGRGAKRIRSALVISELTLATGLLAMAGLVLHSYLNLENVDPGFRKDHVLIAQLVLSPKDYSGDGAMSNFYREVVRRVDALPGVWKAGITDFVPLGGASSFNAFEIPGRPKPASGKPPAAITDLVSAGYFETLGIPILRGRAFDERDVGKGHAIVSAALAKKYFSGVNPIGQKIQFGPDDAYTIVGVVPDIKYTKLSQPQPSAAVYMNIGKGASSDMYLVIHTKLPPRALVKPVQNLLSTLAPNVAVDDIHTMHAQLSDSLSDKQTTMTLLLTFGGIALALAIVGVYAVMSYAVGQRRAECGVRLALGALPEDLQWLVLKDGLRLLAVGLIIGLGLAVLCGYLISAQLFGVMPFDPVTLIGSAIVLCIITLAACYLPARRAAKLDPAVAIMEQ
ncbi:MAG TPA: ABC transporter permease [Gammaproteobacteria bacterium]|nr:ABC transporter permease [Gammaproteobacteria bacterium]